MTRRAAAFILLALLLTACFPKRPDIALPEVPAGELVRALEQRRQDFRGLKAIASIQVTRKDRTRSFETVGVLLESQQRLRMEAFGPFGQSLLALVWDGSEVMVRMAGEDEIMRPGRFGLERLLGAGMEPRELCAVLSGNVPASTDNDTAKAFCGRDGLCAVEFRSEDVHRRVWLARPAPDSNGRVTVGAYEAYRSGRLLFRARFEGSREASSYTLPTRIVVENPDRRTSLIVEYADVEIADRFPPGLFTLSGKETPAP